MNRISHRRMFEEACKMVAEAMKEHEKFMAREAAEIAVKGPKTVVVVTVEDGQEFQRFWTVEDAEMWVGAMNFRNSATVYSVVK